MTLNSYVIYIPPILLSLVKKLDGIKNYDRSKNMSVRILKILFSFTSSMESVFNVPPRYFLSSAEIGYLPEKAGGKLLRRKPDVVLKQRYLHAYNLLPRRVAGHRAVAPAVSLYVNGAVHVDHRAATLPTAYKADVII